MPNILEKTTLRFDQLGVSSGAQIEELFRKLRDLADQEAKPVSNADDLEKFRVRWLGRKKSISARVRENWLKPATGEDKKWVGVYLNWFLRELHTTLGSKKQAIELFESLEPAEDELDLTLPGTVARRGVRHLITQTLEEICDIFLRLGYAVVEGPEMETAYYNFEALNIPEFHPARDTMDTLYLAPDLLLRTHTSPVQVRTMEKQPPPIRIVVPGKVYRHDNPDATHSLMFHQVEGLAVDYDLTFCDFKGTIEHLLREFFGPEMKTRFRPSYFPFTEPSAEVDGSCMVCAGAGCRVCKYVGWIELFGAGMVDPAVYGFVNYDARRLSGFAFGIGVERFAMLKYGIDDIQLFFQNDARFLSQFRR